MARIVRIRAKATTKSAKDTKNNLQLSEICFGVKNLSALLNFAVRALRLFIKGAFDDVFDRRIFNGQVEHGLLGKQAGSDLGDPIGLDLNHAHAPAV
jgi:hypothetical protein